MTKADQELLRLYRIAAAKAAQYKDLDQAAKGVEGHGYPKRLSKLAIHQVTRPKNP